MTIIIEASDINPLTCDHTIGYYNDLKAGVVHIDEFEVPEYVIEKRAEAAAKFSTLTDEQVANKKIFRFAYCPKCGAKLAKNGKKS